MAVTFFGHSDTPECARAKIKEEIRDIIHKTNERTFYVGNQGSFDRMVIGVLSELKTEIPDIEFYVVLAYLPVTDNSYGCPTIFPEKAATAPKKFAISKRNDWLIENSDIVITYVKHTTGGAAKFKEKSEKKNKTVINIAE